MTRKTQVVVTTTVAMIVSEDLDRDPSALVRGRAEDRR